MAFGKREAKVQTEGRQSVRFRAPEPESDGIRRIIPTHLWEGKSGELMRNLGMTPDDASNIATTPELIQQRHDEAKADQSRFLERINSQLPDGAKVIPHAMLPWSIWSQRNASLLLRTCEIHPTAPWNTMLLAEDDMSAFILDVPKHPGGYPQGMEERLNEILDRVRLELDDLHAQTFELIQRGDIDAPMRYMAKVEESKAQVYAVGHHFAQAMFGDGYDKHKKVFGKSLGWPQGI